MGGCKSIIQYEDEDDRILRLRHQTQQRELREFQKQLRKQQCYSQMDLTGKPRSREIPKNSGPNI